MKVLALTVLILVIGSLEAGVVKREIPNMEGLGKLFQSWFDTLKSSTQDLASKFQNGEIQAQAGQWWKLAVADEDPNKAEFVKMINKIVEAGKNLAA